MEGNAAIPEWLWGLGLFASFVVIWTGTLYMVSIMGGWRSLADVYPASHFLPGERFRFQSARMRFGMSYGCCLTLEANPQGFHISVLLPFRIGHPSLSIPWEDITAESDSFFGFKKAKLRFAKCPNIPFSISAKLAEKLSQASGFQFKMDSAA